MSEARLTGSHTSLGFDLHADVVINSKDDQIGHHVEDANTGEDLRVIKWNSFRHLHHPKDDHQVGAGVLVSHTGSPISGTGIDIHLGVC